MINIKRFEKRFNLHSIGEYDDKLNIELSQATTYSTIANGKKMSNLVAVINVDDDISDYLEKVSIIVFTNVREETQEIRDLANKYGKPVFWTKLLKRETSASMDAYLLRKTQTPVRVHGTLLSVFGEGILLTGKSGIGKSEVALELVNRSHLFVGDDAIDVVSFSGTPIGKAPRMSRDFIEVRGVGIINLKGMFGIQSMIKEHNIDLIIELINLDEVKSSIERLGKEYKYTEIAGTEITTIQVPVSSGRSIAPIVEAAVITFKQRTQDGYVAVDDLNNRLKNEDN